MNGLFYFILIATVAFSIFIYFKERWSWKEIHASTAKHPNDSVRIFSALQRNGLRCRLQNNRIRHGNSAANWEQTTFVFVHKFDLDKAQKLIGRLTGKAAK